MKYEMHENLVICPHCGASYQPETEDFSEKERDEKCEACGKAYALWQEFSVTHHTAADDDKPGTGGAKP